MRATSCARGRRVQPRRRGLRAVRARIRGPARARRVLGGQLQGRPGGEPFESRATRARARRWCRRRGRGDHFVRPGHRRGDPRSACTVATWVWGATAASLPRLRAASTGERAAREHLDARRHGDRHRRASPPWRASSPLKSTASNPAAEVLVTGATGGVGSLAVAFLHARDYQPVASTGSPRNRRGSTSAERRGVIAATTSPTVPTGSSRVSAGAGAIDVRWARDAPSHLALAALWRGRRRERTRGESRSQYERLSLHHPCGGTLGHRRGRDLGGGPALRCGAS